MAKKSYKNKITIAGLICIALAGIGAAIYVKSTQPVAKVDTATSSHTTTTKQQAASSSPNSTASNNATAGTNSTASSSANSAGSLPAPTGQLLNKRQISLNSTDPASSPSLESVCQTIPQANCDITLSSGSTVKSVGAQPTTNGTVIFSWNAKTVGLTPGNWIVQAVVTQDGKKGVSHTETLVAQP